MKKTLLALSIILIANTLQTQAQLRLPALISDGMVLQRDKPVKIWGWANPGSQVQLNIHKKTQTTTTNTDSSWLFTIPPAKAGDTTTITIKSGDQSITIHDIIYGDVWLCSGQSNMEFNMSRVTYVYPKEIAASTNSDIRQFLTQRTFSFTPYKQTRGSWSKANPQNILQFTAAGYFMAKELNAKYKVPIGIINTTWGGTPVEAWISEDGLKNLDSLAYKFNYYKDTAKVNQALRFEQTTNREWYQTLKDADKDTTNAFWAATKIPGTWKDQNLQTDAGIVWYKKEIQLNETQIKEDAHLFMGLIADNDSTYFNGVKIGAINGRWTERYYTIPASLLKKGVNTLTIRVVGMNSALGILPAGKHYQLFTASGPVNLEDGPWTCHVSAVVKPLASEKFTRFQNQPGSLYYGMIDSQIPYTLKGFTWYQGEANTGQPGKYQKWLTAMIDDWRAKFEQPDLPFLIVQLTGFLQPTPQPSESGWAGLREAQLHTALSVPNTAVAVTIELGDPYDVHPTNKKEVGHRLALAAEKIAYNDRSLVASGPIYRSQKIQGDKIYLSFDNIGAGLVSHDGKPLTQFAIAGPDRKFVWAQAYIEKDKVVVTSKEIPNPVAVRYAWANFPINPNLWNKDGLPASPFRTDVY